VDDLTALQPDGAGGEEEASAEAKGNKGCTSFFSYSAVFSMVWYRSQGGHWPRWRDISATSLGNVSPQHQ